MLCRKEGTSQQRKSGRWKCSAKATARKNKVLRFLYIIMAMAGAVFVEIVTGKASIIVPLGANLFWNCVRKISFETLRHASACFSMFQHVSACFSMFQHLSWKIVPRRCFLLFCWNWRSWKCNQIWSHTGASVLLDRAVTFKSIAITPGHATIHDLMFVCMVPNKVGNEMPGLFPRLCKGFFV